MSEMTIANKKLMLAGMFLSKFNRQGLEALGYKSLQEASDIDLAVGRIAVAAGVKCDGASTLKIEIGAR